MSKASILTLDKIILLKYTKTTKGVQMIVRKQTSIKVDPQAWEAARDIFKEYNLTLSDAINIFLNKVRLEGGMPFEIKLSNRQTNDQKETHMFSDHSANLIEEWQDSKEDDVWI